jgi:flagellar biosynthesis/type III secretory pathway protein FliH
VVEHPPSNHRALCSNTALPKKKEKEKEERVGEGKRWEREGGRKGEREGGREEGRKEGRKEGKSELQLFPSLMPLATSGPLCPSASSIQLNVLMDLSRKKVDRRQRQQLR